MRPKRPHSLCSRRGYEAFPWYFGVVVEQLKGLLLYCFGAGAGAAGWLLAGVAA